MAASDVWNSQAIGAVDLPSPLSPDPQELVWRNGGAEIPIIRGSAGLVDRPKIFQTADLVKPVGEDEEGNPVYWPPAAEGMSLPGQCLRVLSLPRAQCDCDCPGRQRDGGCLADVSRECHDRGETPVFSIDPEGFWTLTG